MKEKNDEKVVKVDLEEHFHNEKPIPDHDPGVVILYKIKIDDQYFEVRDRHIKGKLLYDLVGKDPKEYQLYQLLKEHGEKKEAAVEPNTPIDLGKFGIERFITKRIYCFKIGKIDYTTEHAKLTVRQILVDYAKVDPDKTTLALKVDGGFQEYKNLDETVPLDKCPAFVLFDNDPLPVS